jgi:hypothetical protein
MKNILRTFPLFFFIFLFFSINQTQAAPRTWKVADVIPEFQLFRVYHSFKAKTILISIQNRDTVPFSCQPNRYLLYQYGKEQFREIHAANLMLDNDFQKAFFTQVRVLGGGVDNSKQKLVHEVQNLLKDFEVSSKTLEVSKSRGAGGRIACWQQAAALDLKKDKVKKFPVLVANFCKSSWCADQFWNKEGKMQLWGRMNPGFMHLIAIDTISGELQLMKKQPFHYRKYFASENAPRASVVTPENIKGKTIRLFHSKQKSISLVWKQVKDNMVEVMLVRTAPDKTATRKAQFRMKTLMQQKDYTEMLAYMPFALWVSDDDPEIKYMKLKLLGAMYQYEEMFNLLEKDFPGAKRVQYCQKIHLDPDFATVRTKEVFAEGFRKLCF